MGDVLQSFRDAKEAFRAQHEDVEALNQSLIQPLQQLGLSGHGHSIQLPEAHSIVRRFLPNLQQNLIEQVIPTWLPSLQEQPDYLLHLEAYFYPVLPSNSSPERLAIARHIALSSYLVLASFLSNPGCPPQSRQFILSALTTLANSYPVDSLYWAVWGGQATSTDGQAELQWEEVIKVLVGLPVKVANFVGARNQELAVAEEVPKQLMPRSYFDQLLSRLEGLLYELSLSNAKDRELAPIRGLLVKLQRQGLLTHLKPASSSSPFPTFWTSIMPSLLRHIFPTEASSLPPYGVSLLPSLFTSLPAPVMTQYCASLLYHLSYGISSTASVMNNISDVKKAVIAFERIMGPAIEDGEILDAVASMLGNGRTAESGAEQRARIAVSWVARGGSQAVKAFIEKVFAIWTDAKYIKFSLFSRQQDITHHFLLSLSRLPRYDPFLISLSRRSQFLLSLSGYLSHPDASIRRLGMLVAEVMSEMTIEEAEEKPLTAEELQAAEAAEIEAMTAGLEGDTPTKMPSGKKTAKRLRFGNEMWEGSGEGREEARRLRAELGFAQGERDCDLDEDYSLGWGLNSAGADDVIPPPPQTKAPQQPRASKPNSRPKEKKRALIQVIGDDDDDDPMLGYASTSPHSSRSASPTQEYLDEIKEDPTLHTGMRDPIRKPVYIQQLVELLRDRDQPEKVERGLADGERLIRAKRGFGTELEENAELLATMAVALTESFGLEGFEEKREGLLIALVACAPKKAAPWVPGETTLMNSYLIEQYFDGQFSLHQRSVILSALALGGREAAGLPNPKPQKAPRIDFPTKALPPALHQKYLTAVDVPAVSTSSMLEAASNELRQLMISKGAKGADSVPEFVRERRLRVGKGPSKVTEVQEEDEQVMRRLHQPVHQPVIPFKDVAAEFFLLPMINRFWQHFQDASTREARGLAAGSRYRGAGTGMVLSPMALEKFLSTLGLLMHAARHSSVYLSVLCPEALDLAATIGTRHLARPDDNPSGPGAAEAEEGSKLEAGVVGAALELALITLDSAQELDGGRTLSMDKGTVVMGVGEWASTVFAIEERGGEVAAGAGGMREGRVRKAAAGVVIRVSDMMEKWRGRMGPGL